MDGMAVVTERHRDMTAALLPLVDERERVTCRSIADRLLELGYLPRREKVKGHVLSFRSPQTGQTIAKIGVRDDAYGSAFYALKFYARRMPPPKFVGAIMAAVGASNGQYRCVNCGVCGAEEGDRGYRLDLGDGEEFVRCGAYVVKIPDLQPEDANDFGALLREQHQYFLSRGK